MKDKIFSKLKQAYSSLGLGDGVLMSQAESLSGFVTDDNIDAVVSAQKSFLEGLQKNTDSRVTEAQKAAKAAQRKEFDEELAKKIEAAKKEAVEAYKSNTSTPPPPPVTEPPVPEPPKPNPEMQAFLTQLKALQDQNKELLDGYNAIKKENEQAKALAIQKAHDEFVLSEAKRLGIPQYRIDEGFTIANDAKESEITDYLTRVSTNIKSNSVPVSGGYQLATGDVSKEEVMDMAKLLVPSKPQEK